MCGVFAWVGSDVLLGVGAVIRRVVNRLVKLRPLIANLVPQLTIADVVPPRPVRTHVNLPEIGHLQWFRR